MATAPTAVYRYEPKSGQVFLISGGEPSQVVAAQQRGTYGAGAYAAAAAPSFSADTVTKSFTDPKTGAVSTIQGSSAYVESQLAKLKSEAETVPAPPPKTLPVAVAPAKIITATKPEFKIVPSETAFPRTPYAAAPAKIISVDPYADIRARFDKMQTPLYSSQEIAEIIRKGASTPPVAYSSEKPESSLAKAAKVGVPKGAVEVIVLPTGIVYLGEDKKPVDKKSEKAVADYEKIQKKELEAQLAREESATGAARVPIERRKGLEGIFKTEISRGFQTIEPITQAVGGRRTFQGTLVAMFGGFMALPAALSKTTIAAIRNTPEEQDFLASPASEAAHKKGLQAARELIKDDVIANIWADYMPGSAAMSTIVQDKAFQVYRQEVSTDLTRRGFSSEQAARLSGEIGKTHLGGAGVGEVAGLVAIGATSEYAGSKLFEKIAPKTLVSLAAKQGIPITTKAATTFFKSGVVTGAKFVTIGGKQVPMNIVKSAVTRAAITSIAPAGAWEGLATGAVQAQTRMQTYTPREAFGYSLFGTVSATAIGTPIVRWAYTKPVASKTLNIFANIADTTEFAGDSIAKAMRQASGDIGKIGRVFKPPVTTIAPTMTPTVMPTPVQTKTEKGTILSSQKFTAKGTIWTDPFSGKSYMAPPSKVLQAQARMGDLQTVRNRLFGVPTMTPTVMPTPVQTKTSMPVSTNIFSQIFTPVTIPEVSFSIPTTIPTTIKTPTSMPVSTNIFSQIFTPVTIPEVSFSIPTTADVTESTTESVTQPVEVPVPVTTPVGVPVPVTIPLLKAPIFPPFLGGGGKGEGYGGRGRRGMFYFPELKIAGLALAGFFPRRKPLKKRLVFLPKKFKAKGTISIGKFNIKPIFLKKKGKL